MLPQFTTMNVIDGQAGLMSYSSLIFYSLTIDNILNIIVLLILAAVSIATLTGENGILTRANDAKEQTEIASEKERVELAAVGALAKDNGGEIEQGGLEEELGKYFEDGKYDVEPGTNEDGTEGYIVTITENDENGRKYFVDKDGNVLDGEGEVTPPSEEPGNPDDNGIFQETSTINGGEATAKNPTIPEGFRPMDTDTSSWGDGTSAPDPEDVGNGLVITDAPDGEVGNEFVWIPVASISEIANAKSGTDTNGNPNYQGKLYNFPTATTSEEKTSYGQGTTSYREPATVTGSNGTSYDGDTTNNYLDIINEILGTTYSSSDTSTFLEDMQKDYNKMVKSIGRYHGFYVSRYEMSKSTTANQAASIANVKPLVNNSSNRWYGLYAYGKTYNTSSVESSMIWGSQYDAMMRWMQDNDIDVKGNIGDKRNRGTTTGTSGTDIINNIYDLYGCHLEWTLEANSTNFRVYRGRLLRPQQFT